MSPVTGSGLTFPGRLEPTNLALRPGELTCLIGPNGSGKTSLLHAFAGIGRPRGDVRIGEIDPRMVPPAQRSAMLSYLPASRELLWPLAARDLVALGLHGEQTQQMVQSALALMELEPVAGRRVDRLSTGERARVLIARALAARPSLLLLDEPTANLDPLWQLRLMSHLEALARQERRTILVALHDLDAAGRHADRLLVMERGRIAADGDPAALLRSSHMPEIFGIAWSEDGWRPVSPSEGRRSSP